MKELFKLWDQTKMIVLIAISAGLYAALLIPFKMFQIIPGFAELRPAACIPIVCSLFFGPSAAWGAAVGNLVADFAGQFGPGSLFGIIGNFLYAYLPYRIWRKYKQTTSKKIASKKDYAILILIVIVSSSVCASSISYGLNLIGLPFYSVAWIIFLNNLIFGIILVPILCNWLDNRVYAWHLNYEEIIPADKFSTQKLTTLSLLLLIIITISSFAIGYLPLLSKLFTNLQKYNYLATSPIISILFIILIFIFSLLI